MSSRNASLPRGAQRADERWGRHRRFAAGLLAAHLLVLGPVAVWVGVPAVPAVAWFTALAGGLGLTVLLRHRPGWMPAGAAGLLAAAGVVLTIGGWWGVLAHVGFLLVAAGVYLGLSRLGDVRRRRSEDHYRRLYEGERAVVARLRELEQLKSQLVAVVSHEFRTPLTSVLGYARTLQVHLDEMDPVAVRSFLASIERQGVRLSGLVDNLVAASGVDEWDRTAMADLSWVTARVAVNIAEQTERTTPSLVMRVPGGLEVPMSASAAHRVLYNLLDNAMKFGDPDGEIRLEARREDGQVVVDVVNSGAPIPPEIRDRMFDAFVQGDSSDSRRAEGLGLGLHVVRRLVESHEGTVEVHDGQGLVLFRVRLPDGTVQRRVVHASG